MGHITEIAYAKINLGLDVLSKREDGYHEVKMIMQTIALHDVLTFEKIEEYAIKVTADTNLLPTDAGNLIYKAARLILDTAGVAEGVRIHLKKRIPIAAGMAGGSSDAAAALRGINRLFSLGLNTDRLRELGVKIGADVPYCIEGGTMLAEGIGEKLTRLPGISACYLVVAKPDISVSTKYVYENLHADTLTDHPDIAGMEAAVRAGDLRGITDRMGNVLEMVTQKVYPVIGQIKEELVEAGALGALMSGSGPSVFGIFDHGEKAEEGLRRLKSMEQAQLFLTAPAEGCKVRT